ncbi:MAG: oxygen-independent coproporphyrinogen III oxidase [Candidatus Omnitrophica bacterium]|nr:oxygen-independent coproporphyrinogen III oxidase [Candidatus Omnitrophota bacterium]
MNISKEVIQKFNIPGPRYTSYPTAPVWDTNVQASTYIEKLRNFGNSEKTLSLYLHIPFCQTLCSFCACNVIIRKREEKYAQEYLDHLFKEIDLTAFAIRRRAKIKQLHWGGGTPNFLTIKQMQALYDKILQHFDIDQSGEIAIEIDPRTVEIPQLEYLKKLGFNRISMGVQDFDPEVQKSINRIQPFAKVREINAYCRQLNFDSINFDLIYGLPRQTLNSFKDTIKQVIALKPDRIALYSFAYVPWLKKHQQKMDKDHLPDTDLKLDLFLYAREQLLDNGYQAIAMDHFALEADEMSKAYNSGRLYRNFMGYTVKPADEYLGLGLTSIGFIENTFVQNTKVLKEYYETLQANQLPVERGKVLLIDDQIRQWVIRTLMCRFEIDKNEFYEVFKQSFHEYFSHEIKHIENCVNQELLMNSSDKIIVTDLGKLFIRNICMGFDAYLPRNNENKNRFSRTV